MASINKLSIRGVRSFSPIDEEQVIEFCFPVTIILGANGCGKTTIIESLKYAVTGSLPPGNKSGQAFVNDPKSCGQSNVKACIKLRFTNRAGNSMVVIRSMEVTQKKSTLSFKALDGILRTQDQNTSDRVSMSHKCSELDRQIPALMGVSKAILEHVVFCHQEDSSWPLQEGAVLKKRFDEIFDSTRYVKALEAIRKTKLEYANIAKDKKVDLSGAESHKYAAAGFRKEMEDCTDKLDSLEVEYDSFNEEIKKEECVQKELEQKLREIGKAREEINDLEQKVRIARSLTESHKSHLENDLTAMHTVDKLNNMLRNFENGTGRKEEYENMEQAISSKKQDISTSNSKMQELRERRGVLSSQRENLDNLFKKRGNAIQDISKEYDITIPEELLLQGGTQPTTSTAMSTQVCSKQDIQTFLTSLEDQERNLRSQLFSKQKLRQEQEDKLQFDIGKLDSEKMTIETDRKRLNTKIQDARTELNSMRSASHPTAGETCYGSSIATYGTSYSSKVTKKDVEDAKQDIDSAQEHSKILSTDTKLQSIPKEIKKYEEKSKLVQRDIEGEREALAELRETADQQQKIQSMQREIERDMGMLKDLPNQNEYLWRKKYSSLLPTNMEFKKLQEMSGKIADKLHENKMKLDKSLKDYNSKERDISVKKALLETSGREKQIMTTRINELLTDENMGVKKIQRVIRSMRKRENDMNGSTNVQEDHNPQELLKYIDESLTDFNADEVSPESVVMVVKQLRKMAKQRDESNTVQGYICPCCDRGMDPGEVHVFNEKIKAFSNIQTSVLVQKNVEYASKVKNEKQQYERWRSLVYDSIDDWRTYNRLSEEIKEKEENISKYQIDMKRLTQELEDLKPELDDFETEKAELLTLTNDCHRMCNDASRINTKQTELRSLQNRIIAPNTRGRTLREVEEELQSKSDEKDDIMTKREKLNKDLMNLNQRVLYAQNELKEKEQLFKEKEAKYEKDQEMNRRKAELSDSLDEYDEADKILSQKLAPLKSQLGYKDNERNRMRKEFKLEEDNLNKSCNKFNNDMFRFQNLHTQIENLEQSYDREALDRLKNKMDNIHHEVQLIHQEIEELEPKLEIVKQKMTQEKRYEKNLQDNIELLQELEELKVIEEELDMQQKEMEMKQSSSNSLQDQYDNSVRRKRKQEESTARCEGRVLSLKEQVRVLRKKLRTPEYKDIDERTRVMMIEYETTIIAISDLEKYYTALDKALLQFHRVKIEDINKIIRELWSLTYKGQDISNIEIVSGQDTGSRAARSYNYRVVMTKGGMTKMDMRGRCSAGQRVLASIVIRLALAETFCLNCGVMTLDEPTTNLDHDNKRGLAIALAQIITARATQQNFQLVTITHDEDFVAMMKNELSSQTSFDMPERYFQVSREEANDGKHYSKINAIDWDAI